MIILGSRNALATSTPKSSTRATPYHLPRGSSASRNPLIHNRSNSIKIPEEALKNAASIFEDIYDTPKCRNSVGTNTPYRSIPNEPSVAKKLRFEKKSTISNSTFFYDITDSEMLEAIQGADDDPIQDIEAKFENGFEGFPEDEILDNCLVHLQGEVGRLIKIYECENKNLEDIDRRLDVHQIRINNIAEQIETDLSSKRDFSLKKEQCELGIPLGAKQSYFNGIKDPSEFRLKKLKIDSPVELPVKFDSPASGSSKKSIFDRAKDMFKGIVSNVSKQDESTNTDIVFQTGSNKKIHVTTSALQIGENIFEGK